MTTTRFRRSGIFFIATLATGVIAACTGTPPPQADECGYAQWSEILVLAPSADPDAPALAGQCLTRAPDLHDDGTPECIVLLVRESPTCDCTAPGLDPVAEEHQGAVEATAARLTDASMLTCYCEVTALDGAAGQACRDDEAAAPSADGEPVSGYCYLDTENGIGNPALTARCGDDSQHLLRFVGQLTQPAGQALSVFCAARACDEDGAGESQ